VPVANLNNAEVLSESYTDALTVVFSRNRSAFACQVFNNAIYYQLALNPASGQSGVPEWEPAEHYLVPSLNSFTDPVAEGFPPGRQFSGIRFRAAAAASPARVSVM
jgi:hypothetical protein